MTGDIATFAAEVTPAAAAALTAYGTAVLAKAKDDLADATVGAGRRALQRIFGRRPEGRELPVVLAEVIENPGDEDYLSALRLAVRKALQAGDAQLLADIRDIMSAARPDVTVNPEHHLRRPRRLRRRAGHDDHAQREVRSRRQRRPRCADRRR